MNEPFWMVWCFVRQAPSKRHKTEQSAIDEAQRLTGKERTAFCVLKCIGETVPPKPQPVVWVKYEEPTPAKDPLYNATGIYKRDCGRDNEVDKMERDYEQYKKQAENCIHPKGKTLTEVFASEKALTTPLTQDPL